MRPSLQCRSARRVLPRLQAAEAIALIQAAAAWAAGEHFVGEILELATASGAAVDVAKGEAFAPLAAPFEDEPGSENTGQQAAEADENEDAERDANHCLGFEPCASFCGTDGR